MNAASTAPRLAVGILHFTAPPVVGGVEWVIDRHAALLAGAGHAVLLIAGRGGRTAAGIETALVAHADARHPDVAPVQRALDAGEVPAGFDRLADAIAAELREVARDLDVLVAHNVCTLDVNAALTAGLRRAHDAGDLPPLVSWVHDASAIGERHRGRLHPGEPWDPFLSPWPGVTTVAVSEARRDELAGALGIPATDVRVVANGIDAGATLDLSFGAHRLVDRLRLDDARPLLLTPARITARKNLELVIDVVTELRRGGDDARAVITGAPDPHHGDGDDAARRLRERIAASSARDAVHLLADLGPWAHTDRVVRDLFRLADALFLPSTDEGFGLPLLEAAAARLPVVCADIPALRELGGAEATYIDPRGDAATAADRIRERLAGDAAYGLRARVRDRYAWPLILRTGVEPVLREAAARAGTRAES